VLAPVPGRALGGKTLRQLRSQATGPDSWKRSKGPTPARPPIARRTSETAGYSRAAPSEAAPNAPSRPLAATAPAAAFPAEPTGDPVASTSPRTGYQAPSAPHSPGSESGEGDGPAGFGFRTKRS